MNGPTCRAASGRGLHGPAPGSDGTNLQRLQRSGRRAVDHSALVVEARSVAGADDEAVDDAIQPASEVGASCRPGLHAPVVVAPNEHIANQAQAQRQFCRKRLRRRPAARAHALHHRQEGPCQGQQQQRAPGVAAAGTATARGRSCGFIARLRGHRCAGREWKPVSQRKRNCVQAPVAVACGASRPGLPSTRKVALSGPRAGLETRIAFYSNGCHSCRVRCGLSHRCRSITKRPGHTCVLAASALRGPRCQRGVILKLPSLAMSISAFRKDAL